MNEIRLTKSTIKLINTLLQLNLKLFKDLIRYKNAFNQFEADINTTITMMTNIQQKQQSNDERIDDGRNDKVEFLKDNSNDNNSNNHNDNDNDAKEKLFDSICEKFFKLSQHLQNKSNSSTKSIDDYDCSIYSILGIVDDLNNENDNDDDDDDDGDEMIFLQKKIDSFLLKSNDDNNNNGFNIKLMNELFKKLIFKQNEQHIEKGDNDDDDCCLIDDQELINKNLKIEYFEDKSEQQQQQQYECKFCFKLFKQITLLIKHQRNKHHPRFICFRCNQFFRNEYVLRIHLRKNQCTRCNNNNDGNKEHEKDEQQQQQQQKFNNNNNKYKCQYPGCYKSFKGNSYLSNHMMTHMDNREYICTINDCKKSYKTYAHLLNHMNQHNGNNEIKKEESTINVINIINYKCIFSNCNFETNDLLQYQQHMHVNHYNGQQSSSSSPNNNQFKCSFCSTVFQKKSSLSNHVKSHLRLRFSCPYTLCSYRCQSNDILTKHIMMHRDNQYYGEIDGINKSIKQINHQNCYLQKEKDLFECKICNKLFTKRSSIINHLRSHNNGYSMTKSTTTIQPQPQQQQSQQQQQSYKCNYDNCLFTTQSKLSLQDHYQQHHHQQQEQNLIPINNNENDCNNQTTTNNQEQQRIFNCRYPNCSYKTTKRPLYRVHMLKHSEIRKHHCQWSNCGKSFKAKSTLNRHLLRHRQVISKHQDDDDDEFIPIEPIDNQQLQQQQEEQELQQLEQEFEQLKQEKDGEEEEERDKLVNNQQQQQYQCDYCPSIFNTRSSLSNHQISHSKPQFRCDKPGCFYETFRLAILERHIRESHVGDECKNVTIYECNRETCQNKQFNSLESLQQHLYTVHNQQSSLNDQPKDEQQQEQKTKRYGCIGWKDCNESFTTKRKLLAHYIEHRRKQTSNQKSEQSNQQQQQRIFKCIWKGCIYQTIIIEQLKKHLYKHRKLKQQHRLLNRSTKKIPSSSLMNNNQAPQQFIAMPFVTSITSTTLPSSNLTPATATATATATTTTTTMN